MNVNLTTCFLLPLVGSIDEKDFKELNLRLFVGKESEMWGEALYIHVLDVDHPFISFLRENSEQEYRVNDNEIGFIWTLTEDQKSTIVAPFLEGKYSKIDRDYVSKNFPEKEFTGFDVFNAPQYKFLVNYKILTKSQELKNWWEERLNCSLPEDAEVWSKPDKKNEIFNYVESVENTHPSPPTVNSTVGNGNDQGSVKES